MSDEQGSESAAAATEDAVSLQREAGGFMHGLLCLPRGATFLLRRPRFWPLAACPLIINIILFSILFVLAIKYALPALVGWLTPEHAPAWLSSEKLPAFLAKIGGWIGKLWAFLIWLVCFLITGVLLVVSFTAVGTVIAAPFNDLLSEWVEGDLLGRATQRPLTIQNLLEDLGRTVGMAARKMGIVVVVFVLTVPLNLIPLAGSLAYTIINSAVAMWYSALEYVDLPMGRAGWKLKERRDWAWERRRGVFAFGMGCYAVLLIPLLGLVVMPAAVAGGTILFVELSDPRRVEESSPDAAETPSD